MPTRPFALLLLVGPFVTACGTAGDVTGAPMGISTDAGAPPDASAAADAASTADATATPGAAVMADAGATWNAQCWWPVGLDAPRDRGRVGCPDVHADAGPSFSVQPRFEPSCVLIDLSTYDRSCRTDSDCMAVSSGVYCPNTCRNVCPSAAINRDGAARYDQTVGHSSTFCECGAIPAPDAYCSQGVCAYCGPGRRCP